MQQKVLVRSLIAAGLLTAAAAGYSLAGAPSAAQPVASTPAATVAAPAATAQLPSFSWIVEKYGPAVVNVSVEGKGEMAAAAPEMPGMDPNDPFFEFFKRFQAPMPRGRVPMRGQGSGFIVTA